MDIHQLRRVVEDLADREAIRQCVMNYARGVDRHDRDLLMSVFHEDAVDDHGMFAGGRVAFVDWALHMHQEAHLSHQHCIFNHVCEVDGDVAHAETYYMFVGMNRTGDPFAAGGGRYIDRFEKRGGRWAISTRVCVRDWAPLAVRPDMADPSVLTAVLANIPPALRNFMKNGPRSSRDTEDLSYARPLTVDPERVHEGRRLLSDS